MERNSRAAGRLTFKCNVEGIAVITDEERLGTSGREAVIEVEDNGCGMSAEFIRDELFKPFRTSKGAGYGIGAFESREYVRENGGRMNIQSETGVGTTVTIRLPAIGLADGLISTDAVAT